MPPAILTWCFALSHVITNPGWVVYKMTTADTGYAFPDLGLFIAVIIAEKQMTYFINWLKYQDTLIYHLAFSSSASSFSNKLWWTLLNLPLNHNPLKCDISKDTSLSQKHSDIIYILLESCFNMDKEVALNLGPLLNINWQGQPLLPTTVPPVQVVQETLWEIYKLNFQFEFKALDC
jgi:hypothetical protein